jgi:hypothetical protein
MQHDRQRRQLVGTGAQHVVGNRAGIERIEKGDQRIILGQQRAGMADPVGGVFLLLRFRPNGWRSSRSWKPRGTKDADRPTITI